MEHGKAIVVGGATVLVLIGAAVYSQFDNWFSNEPTGPGSGDEIIEGSVHDDYIYENTPGSGDELPPDEPTGPGSGDEADVVGSCNTIDDASICVDFIGSFWKTKSIQEANCDGVGAYKSGVPCPQPAMGGCNLSASTAYEQIIWYYSYGGDPFTEAITYAAASCEASGGKYIQN